MKELCGGFFDNVVNSDLSVYSLRRFDQDYGGNP